MDAKRAKKITKQIVKSMGAKKAFKPGELINSKRKPSKKLVATLGLI